MFYESRAYLVILLGTTISAACWPRSAVGQPASVEPSYVVVTKRSTAEDSQWQKVIAALKDKHDASILTYKTSVYESLDALTRQFPRYTCFVVKPEEAGRAFVAQVHQLTRKFDDDPYTDTFWGILTGFDADNALAIAGHSEPLVVKKVASGTEFATDMVTEGQWYDELVKNKHVKKQPGGKAKKLKGPDDTTRPLVDLLNDYKADLMITSGHATERDWQIGFRFRSGQFRCTGGRLYGLDTQQGIHPIDSPNPKVYMPVGNCLMGNISDRDAMALAWMNSAGVKQMLGYTIPTGYGFGGWGCLDYFVEQPGRYTFTEAFMANHHALVHRINDPATDARDRLRLRGDRDVVAFYGDPKWSARMAEMPKYYDQKLDIKDGAYTLTITPNRGEDSFKPVNTNGSQRGWRPIVQFLPHRIKDVEMAAGEDLNAVVTDDFILVPTPRQYDPERKYVVCFDAKELAPRESAPTQHSGERPQIRRCVVVQPIVLRDDHGREPARMRVIESLVDQVYSTAGVDFHFLEPIGYNNTKARDGDINLDQIVKDSKEAGLLRGAGRVMNMFFVNAVDGHRGPLGRGMQNGSLVFIALGDKRFRAQEAFVVAHEAGHNLNLRHALDDPNVPNDVPNLMGEGPFEQRVGLDGLTEYQVDVIGKSRLVHERIRCLNAQEAKEEIVDESFEPYLSQLQRREIAALTAEAPTAETLQACRDQARQRFRGAVLPFTEREEEAVVWLAGEVRDRLANDYPLFAQQPWWFIKVNNRHCGGFSHTRGLCVVFSQRTIDRIVRARNEKDKTVALRDLGPLLVHEQMHVLQRLYPERFASLYTDVFGLVRGWVEPSDWLIERQISNPDGLKLEWIAALPDKENEQRYVWPRTILRGTTPVPQMGRDFLAIAVELKKRGGGYGVVEDSNGRPRYEPLDGLSSYVERFPVSRGLDHPNEIAAYMFGHVFSRDCLTDDRETEPISPTGGDDSTGGNRGERLFVPFRAWCRKNLRLDWES